MIEVVHSRGAKRRTGAESDLSAQLIPDLGRTIEKLVIPQLWAGVLRIPFESFHEIPFKGLQAATRQVLS